MSEATERHVKAAQIVQSRLIERIAQLRPEEFQGLSARDLVSIWKDAVRVERESEARDPDSLARSLGYRDEDLIKTDGDIASP